MSGTEVIGDPTDDSTSWTVKFDDLEFDEMLFSTTNFEVWGIISRDEAIGEYYEDAVRYWSSSSLRAERYGAIMWRRSGVA